MPRAPFAATLIALAALALPAAAAADVQPYQANDYKGFMDIIPPGQNGLANGPDTAAFLTGGARPAHNDDQRDPYTNLLYAAPGLQDADLGKYFPDASFGVKPDDVGRTYSPRADVTIVRDKSFGVPHIYGATRRGDRVRHRLRRGRGPPVLHGRAAPLRQRAARLLRRRRQRRDRPGAVGLGALHRRRSPEADRPAPDALRRRRAPAPDDAQAWCDGVNAYISDAKLDPP